MERYTIHVQVEKILRLVELEGFQKYNLEDALFAVRNRQPIIIRAISAYLKRNVQIMDYDPFEQNDTLPAGHIKKVQ